MSMYSQHGRLWEAAESTSCPLDGQSLVFCALKYINMNKNVLLLFSKRLAYSCLTTAASLLSLSCFPIRS